MYYIHIYSYSFFAATGQVCHLDILRVRKPAKRITPISNIVGSDNSSSNSSRSSPAGIPAYALSSPLAAEGGVCPVNSPVRLLYESDLSWSCVPPYAGVNNPESGPRARLVDLDRIAEPLSTEKLMHAINSNLRGVSNHRKQMSSMVYVHPRIHSGDLLAGKGTPHHFASFVPFFVSSPILTSI